MSATP